MDIQTLLSIYSKDKRTRELVSSLRPGKRTVTHLKGLIGSVDSFVTTSVHNQTPHHHMVVLRDKEEAAYFHNNIENLTGARDVLYFPGSYIKPYRMGELDNTNVLLRAEVLNRLNKSEKPVIIVTYPEAINERVVTKKNLVKNTIDIRVKETISIDFITDFLLEYDFERVDFVVEAGQFAVRGGIVDVFSFANELPYRIEFFGDEVDSMRTFEPGSQLSVQAMNHVTLIPNIQTRLLKESRESLFEFIAATTLIWIKDVAYALDYIEEGYQKALEFKEEEETLIRQLSAQQVFETRNETKAHLEKFSVIEFGTRFYYRPDETITYNIAPQPSFNKNFILLTENLSNNTRKGLKNLIFADYCSGSP